MDTPTRENTKIHKLNINSGELFEEIIETPETMVGASGAVLNNKLYVFGGASYENLTEGTNKIYIYHLDNSGIFGELSMSVTADVTFVQKYGDIILIAGHKGLYVGERTSFIGTFNTATNVFQEIDTNLNSEGGEKAIHQMIVKDDKIFVLYGHPDDVIVGLESFGQANYEKGYNGGMGSNGLTSARHDVFHKDLAHKFPESFDASVPEGLVYSGNTKLTDVIKNSPIDAGKLVLSPTRTYAPIIKEILSKYTSETIHGMVHCSGGAQTKILHFVDNVHVIKDNMFDIPPLFKLIQEQSNTDWKEMYQVFNCGHRMELYAAPEIAENLIAISKSYQVDAKIIGRVEESASKKLTIKSEYGTFEY